MIAERYRGSFKIANLALALITFLVVIDATFLTRADALKDFSVHTFGGSPVAGWLLWFMRAVIVASVVFLAMRWKRIEHAPSFTSILSKDFAFFLSITLFTASAAWVLAGTSMPIIGKMVGRLFALSHSVLSAVQALVGTSMPIIGKMAERLSAHSHSAFFQGQFGPKAEFYSNTQAPIALMILGLMALVPLLPWRGRKDGLDQTGPGMIIAAAALGIPFLAMRFGPTALVATAAIIAVISLAAFAINAYTLAKTGKNGLKLLGGFAAHVGMGLIFVGVVLSANGGAPQKVKLPQGQPVDVALTVLGTPRVVSNYRLTYDGVENITERKAGLNLTIEHNGNKVSAMPTILATKENEVMRAPAIIKGFGRDIYLSTAYVPMAEEKVLALGKPVDIDDVQLKLVKFVIPNDGTTSVGTTIEARFNGKTETIVPYLTINRESGAQQEIVDVPGMNATLGITRMMVDDHAVEIALTPAGSSAESVVLKREETTTAGAFKLTFKKWVMPEGGHEGNYRVGALIEVVSNGKTAEVQPTFDPRMQPKVTSESKPVTIPGAGFFSVELTSTDVNRGLAQINVIPNVALVEISAKPFINLLWLGSILALAGGAIAMWRRYADGSVKEPAAEPESQGKKRKAK
jgi:cytochrome c biogenesis factor